MASTPCFNFQNKKYLLTKDGSCHQNITTRKSQLELRFAKGRELLQMVSNIYKGFVRAIYGRQHLRRVRKCCKWQVIFIKGMSTIGSSYMKHHGFSFKFAKDSYKMMVIFAKQQAHFSCVFMLFLNLFLYSIAFLLIVLRLLDHNFTITNNINKMHKFCTTTNWSFKQSIFNVEVNH